MATFPRALVALVAALALALTGCGGDDPKPASSGDHNRADVAFATDMIPHHAQALMMVDMAAGRPGLSPKFADLLEQIRSAQTPEIEEMSGWLEGWDEKVPSNSRDHAHEGMDDMQGMDHGSMPGMMSQDDLDALEAMSGDAFETHWLELMIEHHHGAIEMAQEEIDAGQSTDALALARSIAASQADEITQMEQMLTPA